jgi:hypothetical protein
MDGSMSYGPSCADIRVTESALLKGARKYHASNDVVRKTLVFSLLAPAAIQLLS